MPWCETTPSRSVRASRGMTIFAAEPATPQTKARPSWRVYRSAEAQRSKRGAEPFEVLESHDYAVTRIPVASQPTHMRHACKDVTPMQPSCIISARPRDVTAARDPAASDTRISTRKRGRDLGAGLQKRMKDERLLTVVFVTR